MPTDIASYETVGEAKDDDRLKMVTGIKAKKLADRYGMILPVWFVTKDTSPQHSVVYGATAKAEGAPLKRYQ